MMMRTTTVAVPNQKYDQMAVHQALNKLGIQGFIPRLVKRGPAKTFRKDEFEYDANGDFYRCPIGHALPLKSISRTNGQKVYAGDAATCQSCPLRLQCVPQSARMKHITRPLFQDAADTNYSHIGTEEYTWAQRVRRIVAEGTFGLLKRLHNLARARMRGRERVHEQALMSALALNLKRMVKAAPLMA